MKRIIAMAAVVLSVAAAPVSAASTHPATKPKVAVPTCTIMSASYNAATHTASAKGESCRLKGKAVASVPKVMVQKYDSSAMTYACGSPSIKERSSSATLEGHGTDKVTFVIQTAKKWGGKIISSKSYSLPVTLDDGSALMCGKYTTVPPANQVCDWGIYPGYQNSCGSVWMKLPNIKAVVWGSKPTMNSSGQISAGHLLSVSGVCQAYPMTGTPSTPSWMAVQQWTYWNCGTGVNAYAEFEAWLVEGSKSCHLNQSSVQGAMKFTLNEDWGGTLKLLYRVVTFGSQSTLEQAYEFSSAYFKLNGSGDGCQELGLPTN